MKRAHLAVWICSVLFAVTPSLRAQCLVFRVKQLTKTTTDLNGLKKASTADKNKSSLIILDTEQNFVVQSSEDESGAEDITLYEAPRSAAAPAVKAFRHSPAKDDGSIGFTSVWRYGLYAKKAKFYLTFENHQAFTDSSVEQGIGATTGTCLTNRKIGGNRLESIPANTTCTASSVERSGAFSQSVFSLSYDATLTVAVNDHLAASPPQPVTPSFASKNIIAAREFLIGTYLPKYFPDAFPR